MKCISSAEMRELDAAAMAEHGIPGTVLMERAGIGVAAAVFKIVESGAFRRPRACLFAGHGNNGGDIFVAARHLAAAGFCTDVWLVGDRARIAGDALHMLKRMEAAGVHARPWTEAAPALEDLALWNTIVVDGILGTGISGAPREPAASAIELINSLGQSCSVVAVDTPSGLDGDTGVAAGAVVRADVTATMALPKTGLVAPAAVEYVGVVEVIDIGMPEVLTTPLESLVDLIAESEVGATLPSRPRVSHKGTFGHVLIVGGSNGFSGAAALTAMAATRSGVGLVSVATPAAVARSVAATVPAAMVHACVETGEGALAGDALAEWPGDVNAFDAVVVGPGMTTGQGARTLLRTLLSTCAVPLVLDADALNLVAAGVDLADGVSDSVVLTPHPGELARLLNSTVADIQADRLSAAQKAADRTAAVVVLKGVGTVVAAPGCKPAVNMTGNPGMATGGTGDVLAGLLGGLLAQGMPARDAAMAAVYVHGCAGDRAARHIGLDGLTAIDVADAVPVVLKLLRGR